MQLMVATFNNYQQLVDRALVIEGKQQQIDNHKRKYGHGKYNSGAQQRPRFTPNSGRPLKHNYGGHNHNGGVAHNHSVPSNANGNGGSNGQNRTNPATPAKKDLSHITCFKCGKNGHYATECSEAKMEMAMEALGRIPTLSTGDK